MRSASAFGAASRGTARRIASRSASSRRYSAASAGIGAQVALEFERAHRVELAVEGGVEAENAVVGIVGHGSAFRALASAPRARARRDITVPIGAPVASAMSR